MNCDKFSTTCWYYGFNKNENHEDQHRQPKETTREISDQLALVMNRGKYVYGITSHEIQKKKKLPCNFSTFEYQKPCKFLATVFTAHAVRG